VNGEQAVPAATSSRLGLPDVVVFSPHLDDAVLSIGALIARLVRDGRHVEVWTAFTRQPDLSGVPRTWRPFGDYATRLAEDDRALNILGAGSRRLGLPERIWRQPRPRSLAGAFRGPTGTEGFACLPALTATMAEVLACPEVELYAPLGIGQHTDHVEVALAALQAGLACGALHRVGFYEDFYALGEAFRSQHPVSRALPDPRFGSPGLAAPLFGAALRMMAAASSGPHLDDYLPGVRAANWQWERHPVTGAEQAKLAAVIAYRSQVSRLGGRRQLESVLRRAHRVRGGELIWRATMPQESTRAGPVAGSD
jgi:LmbE family N-acetylglucosaminyl deacetylase